MKIFTKSLLTLALLCVAGVANADRSWQKIFAKGWVHEYRDGSSTQTSEEARVDDEGAYYVYSRGLAESGNASLDDWDSQFFIVWDASMALFEGDKIKVTMKVKAENPTTSDIGSQSHNEPGNYNYWQGMDGVKFTDEWTEWSSEKEVNSNMAIGENKDKPGFYSIAFNLTPGLKDDEGAPLPNTYFFKDIEVELFREKGVTKTVISSKVVLAESWISNGDIENENLASFPVSHNGGKKGEAYPEDQQDTGAASFLPEIEEGPGLDGNITHYLKVMNDVEPAETWGTQFFILADKVLPTGTEWVLEMDVKADNEDASVSTGYHADPRSWRAAPAFDAFTPTTEWQHYRWTGTIPSHDRADLQSIALDLNNTADGKGNDGCAFYFDNIVFGYTKKVASVENNEECIQILFPAYTNMPDLILAKVGNKARMVLPDELAGNFKVTIDGQDATIGTIEYDKAGQLYIFLEDEMTEDSKVVVNFTNPAEEDFKLIYTNGDNVGNAVENFQSESEFNGEIEAVPFAFGVPDIESADPEDKSFGIEASLNQFIVVFDKAVMGDKIEAKLDGEKLNVVLGEDGATATLTRTGTAALAEGQHTITITKVYAATDVQLTESASFTLTFTVGAKAMPEDLLYALNAAKEEYQTSSEDPENRYAGEAQTALNEAITKYEAEGATYTAPSQVNAAIKELSEKTEASKKHRTNCDTFDQNMRDAETILAESAAFADHELYVALKTAYDKYAAMGTVSDDAVLVEAIAALDENVAAGKLMFTSGESGNGDTGIKVLVERIRLGKEALLALGASEDDELIVAANKATTDDEALANRIADHLALKVCEALKDEATAASMFEESEVDEEGNLIPTRYDMSVFIKNPNIYKEGTGKNNVESVPGWEIPTGIKNCGISGAGGNGWGNPRNTVGLPEDVAFSGWRPQGVRFEQTIENLPAGIYQFYAGGCDWAKHNEGETYAYVRTETGANAALVPEDATLQLDKDLNVSAYTLISHDGEQYPSWQRATWVDPVEVIDGKLIVGVQFGAHPGVDVIQAMFPDENLSTQDASTQYFFDLARLYIVGAIEGHDYAADYNQIITNVVSSKTAKVRSIELYDLNGRRIVKANKGLAIVKRVMSDGSIKADKVVK